jgi:hypothetical protein
MIPVVTIADLRVIAIWLSQRRSRKSSIFATVGLLAIHAAQGARRGFAESALTVQVRLQARAGTFRFTPCTLPRTALLAAVEADLRGKGFVAPKHAVAFVMDGAASSALPKTARIGDLDLRNRCLCALIGEDAESAGPDLAALAATVQAALSGERVQFGFVLPAQGRERKREFELPFAPSQTVRDVKIAVLGHLGRSEDDAIDLLFAGKALRDEFVLERLRIGSCRIVVFLTSNQKLFIPTIVRSDTMLERYRLAIRSEPSPL